MTIGMVEDRNNICQIVVINRLVKRLIEMVTKIANNLGR